MRLRFGVCCLFIVSASGSTINQNCTYLTNPRFPNAYTDTGSLSFTVTKCSPGNWFRTILISFPKPFYFSFILLQFIPRIPWDMVLVQLQQSICFFSRQNILFFLANLSLNCQSGLVNFQDRKKYYENVLLAVFR